MELLSTVTAQVNSQGYVGMLLQIRQSTPVFGDDSKQENNSFLNVHQRMLYEFQNRSWESKLEQSSSLSQRVAMT